LLKIISKLSLLHNCTNEESYFYLKIMFSHEIVISSPRGNYSLGEGNMCLSIGALRVLSMVPKCYHWQK